MFDCMKKILYTILVAAIVIVAFAACKKSRYCYCTTKEGEPDTVVVNVDRSMKCDRILEMGFERLDTIRNAEGEIEWIYVSTTQKVKCKELDTDTTVVTIPDED